MIQQPLESPRGIAFPSFFPQPQEARPEPYYCLGNIESIRTDDEQWKEVRVRWKGSRSLIDGAISKDWSTLPPVLRFLLLEYVFCLTLRTAMRISWRMPWLTIFRYSQ